MERNSSAQPALTNPTADDHFRRGLELQKEDKLEAAIAEYRQALQTAPSAPVLANLGSVYARLGRYPEAITQYQQALHLTPNHPKILMNMGLSYYKMGELGTAIPLWEKVLQLEPENIQVCKLLADGYYQQNQFSRVIQLLTGLKDQYLEDRSVVYLLGNSYLRSHQIDKGREYIDRLLAQGDSAEVHLMMGIAQAGLGQNSQAMAEFRRALAMNSSLPLAHSCLGFELLRLNELDQALTEYEAEIGLNPHDYTANFFAGYLRRLTRDYENARFYLANALRQRPRSLAVQLQLSLIAMATNRWTDSQKMLEAIVLEDPEFMEAHENLARVYYHNKLVTQGEHEQVLADQLRIKRQEQQPSFRSFPGGGGDIDVSKLSERSPVQP